MRALSRCLSLLENDPRSRSQVVRGLPATRPDPIVVGMAGAPGVGKSSILNELLYLCPQRFSKMAVLLFDPSSPRSGGAVLGDRLRMSPHAHKEFIFVRSFAVRQHLGGVCHAIYDMLWVLRAAGFDLILIETVGSGQNEQEIADLADVTLLVMDALAGDVMQLLKAGMVERADIVVLNKNDRVDTSGMHQQMQHWLHTDERRPTILSLNVFSKALIRQLFDTLCETLERYERDGILAQRRRLRYVNHVKRILHTAYTLHLEQLLAQPMPPIDDLSQNPYDHVTPWLPHEPSHSRA